MKYKELSEKIIDAVGGKNNIEKSTHCMTRLRLTLKDSSLADTESIKKFPEVIDVNDSNISYQIIIGTEVAEVYEDFSELLGEKNPNNEIVKEKKNIIKSFFDFLSESMSPILIPIMAAGMLAAVLSILVMVGLLTVESPTYVVLDSIRQAVFYFLPVLLAMSCSKKLGVNQYLAVTLAATLLIPGINGAKGLSIFGLSLPQITYSNSFFPIIMGIAFMAYIEKLVNKVIPKGLQFFFGPVLVLIITLPVTLLIFGPIGTWIGDGIAFIAQYMMDHFGNWSVVMLYAAIQPFLITLGAGNFVLPIMINFFATLGYDPVFMVAAFVSDFAVAGAVMGYFFKTKDTEQKQLFGTTAFSALMNVTEPAIYGVFVKYRKPYIATLIGGAVGGLFAGITQVKAYAMVGILGISTYAQDGNMNNLYFTLISIALGFSVSMIAAYLLGIPQEDSLENSSDKPSIEKDTENKLDVATIYSPVTGQKISLTEVNDSAFSSQALGKGIAVIPRENQVCAPVDGEVTVVFPTKHAIGIKTSAGVEVLIHIGINTVELEGKYFESLVKVGDHVEIGQPLVNVDFPSIKKEGYDPVVMMVVTNTSDYLDIVPTPVESLTVGEKSLTIVE